jgi:hypothetical protein
MVVNVAVALGLFVLLYLAVIWSPGLILGVFALAFAADSNAVSQVFDRRRRVRAAVAQARTQRGGWTDSAAARP